MNFLIISHGPLAKAALASAEMIMGEQKNVKTLAVNHDTTLEGMEQEIETVYHHFDSEDLIIFCDILGGTPSNASLRFKMKHPAVEVVTGFNLPVLIEVFISSNLSKEYLLEVIKTAYNNGQTIIELPNNDQSNYSEIADL